MCRVAAVAARAALISSKVPRPSTRSRQFCPLAPSCTWKTSSARGTASRCLPPYFPPSTTTREASSMPEIVTLPAVKRIEGHGRVSLFLDEAGSVNGAHFDVVEFRGFEKMLVDRMVWEMPLITSRICGVCPVSHHVAAVRAVDALYGVEIPRAAQLLRELLHLGGFSQDHALHFFFLAGPDFLTGDGAGSRDLLGVIEARPDLARRAIALRKA
ncbi:MAG: hypothetical protein FDZ75_01640, partial [Actinobacteria bacterium]